MKKSKSTGCDNISSFFIKKIPRIAAVAITHLFNRIIEIGKFPLILKQAKVIPVLKPGKDYTRMESYHPISNLSTVNKVIERLLKEQLEKYFKDNPLFRKENL